MRNNDILMGLVGLAVVGYMAYRENETRKVIQRIGVAADKVKDAPDWKLAEGFLETAVMEAAESQTKRAFANVQSKVEAEFSSIARAKVREAVNACSDKIASNVGDEIARQSMEIDKDVLMKKAIEKASSKALEKFDKKLDDVLDDLEEKLGEDRFGRRRRIVML